MKRKHTMKTLSILLACTMLASAAAGCGNSAASSSEAASSSQASSAAASSTSSEGSTTAAAPEEISWPLFEDKPEISIFWRLNPKATASMKDYTEMRLWQVLGEKANCTFTFVHPPMGKELEQFNLLRVSGDYPDVIYWENWLNPTTVGGPEKALNDNFIIPMNDLMAQYAPNFTKLMNESEDIKRAVTTDDGTFYGFPLLRYNQSMKGVWGFLVRQDWLDTLGLEKPTTIDEYHDMLVAFRDGDPNGNGQKDEVPLSTWMEGSNSVLMTKITNIWGVNHDFSVQDKKAVYGPYTEEWRQAVTTLNQWYSEGLIDPDFAVNDERQYEDKCISNVVGAIHDETGGSTALMNQSLDEMGVSGDTHFVGIPIPKLSEGAEAYNLQHDLLYNGVMASISSQSQYQKELTKLFDYGYSEEGNLLWNFGIEGESYNMVDGKSVLSETITNNPDGLSIDQALARYCFGSMQGPFVFSPEVRDQRMLFFDWQRESINAWNQDSADRLFPPATLSEEESQQYAEIMADITTYVAESFNGFVQGTKPLSEFDSYLEQLKNMGVEEAIALKQASVDRYYAR